MYWNQNLKKREKNREMLQSSHHRVLFLLYGSSCLLFEKGKVESLVLLKMKLFMKRDCFKVNGLVFEFETKSLGEYEMKALRSLSLYFHSILL